MLPHTATAADRLQQVFAYHQATKHQFHAYARSPGYLDWATQPDPFRRYSGARLLALQKIRPADEPRYDDLFTPRRMPAPAPVDLQSVSQLFFDSLALSAWKSAGGTSWALRVNASSGNLHPTEGYLLCGPVDGLCEKPMVCHYAPREHGLEVRAEFDAALWTALSAGFPEHTFFVGLTSIHWREAWKYGQRAYRYCMHDVGHALGAISVAAGGLGWQTRLLDELGTRDLALLLGTSVEHTAEREEPDLLLACVPARQPLRQTALPAQAVHAFQTLVWRGGPNHLSPAHVDWGMEDIAAAAHKPHGTPAYAPFAQPPAPWPLEVRPVSLRRTIRQRRSAVAMDGRTRLARDTFYRILYRALAVPDAIPFSTLPWKAHIHLAILVHRVDDIPAGLYLLARDAAQTPALQQALTQANPWQKPPACPEQLPLYCLLTADVRAAARAISCHQDIASDSCFSLAMIAEYTGPLKRYGAWFYPRLFWEAGMIGQLLYLEAEAAGLRSTGIGCFFDDAMHEVLGLEDRTFQDLYHFTLGGPVEDQRLTTLPAYADE
jgi:SagB-type dehydrogenase family enzyme